MPTRASRNEKNKKLKKATKKLQRKDATRKVSAGIKGGFKLTYATMFDPPEEMHSRLEKALADVKFSLIDSLEEGLSHANDVDYGLTAGFYGSKKEVRLFFNNIHAGVTYANRPQGLRQGLGQASSHSADGRGPVQVRAGGPCIIFRSICANNRKPWSNDLHFR